MVNSTFFGRSTLDYKYGLEGRKILIFEVIFQCEKSAESFRFFLKNIRLGDQFLLMTVKKRMKKYFRYIFAKNVHAQN